jgi:teichuronic acid exporter
MSIKQQLISGFFWTYLQKFSSQLINFFISLVLSRLLLPEDFGMMGLIYVFITIGNVLIDSGLSLSLIRTKHIDQEDYSTVFIANIAFGLLIYLISFLIAPFISNFYNIEILTTLIRVFALTFIITSFSSVQTALLTKKMLFKTQLFIAIPSLIISGIVGITLAFFNFGVWSLVYASLSQNIIGTIQLWIYSDWRPKPVFNTEKFKVHFKFGYKLIIIGIFDAVFVNIYPILIGKLYNIRQVGFYTQAEALKQLPISNISSSLAKVTLPMFSRIQDENIKIKNAYDSITKMALSIIAPILIFISALAEPLLHFLYSEKWVAAAPYLSLLCFAGILPSINGYNLNILNAKGKSNYILRIETFNKLFLIILIASLFKFGIYALIWSKVISTLFSYLLNSFYCGKEINYKLIDQVKVIVPILIIAGVAGVVVSFSYSLLNLYLHPLFLKLLIAVLIGITTYLFLIYSFKREIIFEFHTLSKQIVNNAK